MYYLLGQNLKLSLKTRGNCYSIKYKSDGIVIGNSGREKGLLALFGLPNDVTKDPTLCKIGLQLQQRFPNDSDPRLRRPSLPSFPSF